MIDNLHPTSMVSLLDSQSNTNIPITQVKISSGLRTLGVRLAPNGNFRDEFKHRMDQVNNLTTNLKK